MFLADLTPPTIDPPTITPADILSDTDKQRAVSNITFSVWIDPSSPTIKGCNDDQACYCESLKTLLPPEDSYRAYVVDVDVGGSECVREYGVHKEERFKEHILSFSPAFAHTATCLSVVIPCEAAIAVSTGGATAAIRAKDIALETLGCALAPALSTITYSLTPAYSPYVRYTIAGATVGTLAHHAWRIRRITKALETLEKLQEISKADDAIKAIEALRTIYHHEGFLNKLLQKIPNTNKIDILSKIPADSSAKDALEALITGGRSYDEVAKQLADATKNMQNIKISPSASAEDIISSVFSAEGTSYRNALEKTVSNVRNSLGSALKELKRLSRAYLAGLVCSLVGQTAGSIAYVAQAQNYTYNKISYSLKLGTYAFCEVRGDAVYCG